MYPQLIKSSYLGDSSLCPLLPPTSSRRPDSKPPFGAHLPGDVFRICDGFKSPLLVDHFRWTRAYQSNSDSVVIVSGADAQTGNVSCSRSVTWEVVHEPTEYLVCRDPQLCSITRRVASTTVEGGWDEVGRIRVIV